MDNIEIERKFLIAMPDAPTLSQCEHSDITQTYITPPGSVGRERVRKRCYADRTVYTHTAKQKLSDLSRVEIETEISEADYEVFLQYADRARRVIEKTRYILPYCGQNFEIDVFPFWHHRAIMELELHSEEQPIDLPPFITVVREFTSDERYTNSALALSIPNET